MERLQNFFQQTARSGRRLLFFQQGQAQTRSFAEMYQAAERLAGKLKTFDLPDRFLAIVWLEQTPLYLETVMAVILAGGIPVPLHAFSKWEEVQRVGGRLEADIYLLTERQIAAGNGQIEPGVTALCMDVERETCLSSEHSNGQRGDRPNVGRINRPHPETAMIFTSSGSTGVPKCIQLSAVNMLSNLHSIQGYVQLQDTDRVLLTKSFGYASTLIGEWMLALQAGADLQLSPGFLHPLQMVKFIKEQETTFLCTVPSTVIPLLKSSKWRAEDLATLRQILIVGGGLAPQMLLDLHQRLGGAQVIPSYGLTEASPRVSYLPAEQLTSRPHSVGIPVQDVTVRIVDEHGQAVAPGTAGEIVVYGPNVMLGYYAAEKTAALQPDRGLRTKDVGYLDEEGYLYVTGRIDSALNVGGQTLYPERIEKVLAAHPNVLDVGVAGVADAVYGQRAVAYVVPQQAPLDADALYRYAQQHLQSAERPRSLYEVKDLPKTKSGKLDRAALQARAWEWENGQPSD